MSSFETCPDILAEVKGSVGLITLNRPKALNALNLPMVRALATLLIAWKNDPNVKAVAVRGMGREHAFGAFCAGGDIRFFHQSVLHGDAQLEDFFTEEYELNHLIHTYPKPYIAFMDGIVMGGGMGISQGASLRIVTQRTKMAMPETQIGLFPDVGGGWFLARCPGHSGEWLALTSEVISAGDAIAIHLADACFDPAKLDRAWDELARLGRYDTQELNEWQKHFQVPTPPSSLPLALIEKSFDQPTVFAIEKALMEEGSDWSKTCAAQLRSHSPLMQEVSLQLIRRGGPMSLADELRMERDMVRHCFNTRHLMRFMTETETMEGIRALAIDKDRQPKWNPEKLEMVTSDMVAGFFDPVWPPRAHPLRHLV